MKMQESFYMPAEWTAQSFVQLTWPHEDTDWAYMLEEVTDCFINIAREIAKRQALVIVTPEPEKVLSLLTGKIELDKVRFVTCDTNDTWARDHAFITLLNKEGKTRLLDFCFNGWGLKFAANFDNQINHTLYNSGILQGEYVDCLDFVLEGGSIESDGNGTLLTTSTCLLAPNRNPLYNTKELLTNRLTRELGVNHILWLDHGYLAGDDTDSHVDTLARLCPDDTIAYVQCTDMNDEHYEELSRMEKELHTLRTSSGKPYKLVALPWPDAIHDGNERLPATYANFLIINGAVLLPTYNQPEKDKQAQAALTELFPDREIVCIDCCALIRQHGSLHCVTMQYPASAMNSEL